MLRGCFPWKNREGTAPSNHLPTTHLLLSIHPGTFASAILQQAVLIAALTIALRKLIACCAQRHLGDLCNASLGTMTDNRPCKGPGREL